MFGDFTKRFSFIYPIWLTFVGLVIGLLLQVVIRAIQGVPINISVGSFQIWNVAMLIGLVLGLVMMFIVRGMGRTMDKFIK